MKPSKRHWFHCSEKFHGERWTAMRIVPRLIGLGEGCACVVITCATRDIEIAHKMVNELFAAFQREKNNT